MGLDMFLYIQKEKYISAYQNSDELQYPENILTYITFKDKCIIDIIKYKVGYWRKANAIHNWIVENCAYGEDCAQEIYINIKQLKLLLDTCNQVLLDHTLASSLLPTKQGFFFDCLDYNEYYYHNIERTIEILNPVIKFMENHKNTEDYDWSVIYHANW